jgi:PEP-CTERM motif-containing protein
MVRSFYTVSFYSVGFSMVLCSALLAQPGVVKASTITVDFNGVDASAGNVSGVPLTNYLSSYGISLTPLDSVTSAVIASDVINTAALADPGPNFFAIVGTQQGAGSLQVNFAAPLTSFTFTRIGQQSLTGNGTTGPAWTAYAYDANGNLLSSVGEGLLDSFGTVPPATYTLAGSGTIKDVVFDSNNFFFAGHFGPWLDEFVMNEATPEPATLTLIGSGFLAIGGLRFYRRRNFSCGKGPASESV